jgi:hypothetical protein
MKTLNDKKVASIKDLIARGYKQPAIAKEFGISRSAVSDIATGRRHTHVPWPESVAPKKPGGQRRPLYDPTNTRILELESEVVHLTEERNRERRKSKSVAKTQGLFRAIVSEMEHRIRPFTALPTAAPITRKVKPITEHVVMHLSDMHADQVITPEECGGLEEFNFPIACARAERYVDTVIEWTQDTLAPKFKFTELTILAYGDFTSGEIHGHGERSYYRNSFKNCLAIGQLQAMMYRDLAPHFSQINVLHLSGNHGRRTAQKDFHGAQNNFDYLIGEIARLHCRDIPNIHFTIPNCWSANIIINEVGFNLSHGDDVRSNGGIPWYALTRRQKGLIALGAARGSTPIRYFVIGHHHCLASLSDINGEMVINGAWPGTDSFSYNSFSGYREPCQLLHGVNPKHGITWRMNVKLKHENEKAGPKRYKIDGGREVGPLV